MTFNKCKSKCYFIDNKMSFRWTSSAFQSIVVLTSEGRRKSVKVDYVLLGDRIKFWRQYRNFTQEKLAEKVELTPGFISLIETGKKRASLETLLFISKELEIALNDLLLGNQITQPNDYSIEFAESISDLNEAERNMIFEISKAKLSESNHGLNLQVVKHVVKYIFCSNFIRLKLNRKSAKTPVKPMVFGTFFDWFERKSLDLMPLSHGW